ncbi:MAG: hypothetical protein C6Y22_26510 [Hapalosiphonaceae cyanobacterium JJU2]|nr:MAG: hypothetical protein C6Y22_26510 [Hapalosiphonaceae cyanobacterium JJU2]
MLIVQICLFLSYPRCVSTTIFAEIGQKTNLKKASDLRQIEPATLVVSELQLPLFNCLSE